MITTSCSFPTTTPTEAPAFIRKLREIMDQSETYAEVIAWAHDGMAIEIKNEEAFVIVVGKIFNYSNLNSFIRQLNVYGFKKTQRTLKERVYFHPEFIQNRPALAAFIRRKPRRRCSLLSKFESSRTEKLIQRGRILAPLPQLPSLSSVLANLQNRLPLRNRPRLTLAH